MDMGSDVFDARDDLTLPGGYGSSVVCGGKPF